MLKRIFTIMLVAVSLTSYAQKIKITEGSLKPLKGQKSVNTQFTYENMLIGGKGLTEQDYIEKRKKELDEKEPGRGAKFETAWFADRKERFEPQFRELLSKHAEISTVDEKAQYTIIIHTTRTEVADPSKVVAKITMLKSPGSQMMGMDFETGVRLQEAYAKAGKELGKLITKETK
jgi:hypothetical protein